MKLFRLSTLLYCLYCCEIGHQMKELFVEENWKNTSISLVVWMWFWFLQFDKKKEEKPYVSLDLWNEKRTTLFTFSILNCHHLSWKSMFWKRALLCSHNRLECVYLFYILSTFLLCIHSFLVDRSVAKNCWVDKSFSHRKLFAVFFVLCCWRTAAVALEKFQQMKIDFKCVTF